MKISEYKRGFADGTIKQIEITKELIERERKKYSQALSKALKFRDKDISEILKKFKDKDIYTGRIVKFEIENRLKELARVKK